MCYVCHQRELRNVPIYLAEERKKKEKLHERLLHEFQQKKAALLHAQEKVLSKLFIWVMLFYRQEKSMILK